METLERVFNAKETFDKTTSNRYQTMPIDCALKTEQFNMAVMLT